ncbi:MAG: flavin reductase family protein, partial [Gammaproteobacteria bacterium]
PDGGYDLAPKHMAMPVSWKNHYGFVCAPHHRTYQNIRLHKEYTVSYPRPSQIVLTSLAADPRTDDDTKPALKALPTFKSDVVDGVFIKDAYLFLECRLEKIVDDIGGNSLIIGEIVGAQVDEDFLRVSEGDDQELIHASPMLAYLYPGRFAKIDQSFSFPFPNGFRR